ncbi:MAG: methyltransferase domain-containing protein [Chloroflexota bacterium]
MTTNNIAATIQTEDDLLATAKDIARFSRLFCAPSRLVVYQYVELAGPRWMWAVGMVTSAELVFPDGITAGIDLGGDLCTKHSAPVSMMSWFNPLAIASPFPDNYFGGAFSNSVLEHIPDIQPVLNEVSRVLKPGARFLITMPSHLFTQNLAGPSFERISLDGLADRYRVLFNKISRHAHTGIHRKCGRPRLAEAGMQIEKWQYYFPRRAPCVGVRACPGITIGRLHALTGHWIIAPWESSLQPTNNWLRPFMKKRFRLKVLTWFSLLARCRPAHSRCSPCATMRCYRMVNNQTTPVVAPAS